MDNIKLSSSFKQEAAKAVSAIVLFVVVFLLITLVCLALALASIMGGFGLIIAYPRFITIILGLGLASIGVLLVIFLFKFIFSKNKPDYFHLTEITEADQPQLFKLIKEIVSNTGTKFPKKVYLDAGVNAGVFYNSTFWSMFFPVKKNLQIGMGLINTVTEEELKAILSHEFGHFSQSSMKVGSYVYNFNHIIHNMLFENEAFNRIVEKWENLHSFFVVFTGITGGIVKGIQWLLRQMYNVVNKSYLGLSREMEFHADEIAAHITGYPPLKNSLLRADLSNQAYDYVLNYYAGKIEENITSGNIYPEQLFAMNALAKAKDIEIENGLPVITLEETSIFNKSKLNIKDQWASHPTTKERIDRLEQTQIVIEGAPDRLANNMITDIENWQEKLTRKLFQNIEYSGEVQINSFSDFAKDLETDQEQYSFSKLYNGYYDRKNPIPFDVEDVTETNDLQTDFSDLFSMEKLSLIYESIALQNDIEIVKQIANKDFKIKSFDYLGKKYNPKSAKSLSQNLDKELNEITNNIKNNDICIYQFFRSKEKERNEDKLKSLYRRFFEFDKWYDDSYQLYFKIMSLAEISNYQAPIVEINRNFNQIADLEKKLKPVISDLLKDETFPAKPNEAAREILEKYISKDFEYFDHPVYDEENLAILFSAMNSFYAMLIEGYFLLKKEILEYQITLLGK